MRSRAALLAFALLASPGALAADPPGLMLQAGAQAAQPITLPDVAALPAVSVTLNIGAHDARPTVFEGPLLWALLANAHAIDPAKPRDHVRQTVTATGRDGYSAVLALGEIDPEFEGKQVIVADTMDGRKLDADHLRLVVPGDHRGGRSVRDLARLTVAP